MYEILLVLSRCCFHHLVENSILYKKDIQHFCIGPILFSENKIIRSVVGKVDGQILSGTRSEKPKILFGTRDEKRRNLFGTKLQFRKILFGSQRVKLLRSATNHYHKFISFAKKSFYSSLVHSSSSNPRALWKTINKILHRTVNCSPTTLSPLAALPQLFANYFSDNISKLHFNLQTNSSQI